MTLIEKIAYELITKNVLDMNALKTLGPTLSNVYRQLERLISAGYIRQKSYTFKIDRKKKTIDYYSLTSSGFCFFASRMSELIPWLEYEPDESQDVRVIDGSNKSSAIASRYVKVSTTAVMADMAGANENTLFTSVVMTAEDQLVNTTSNNETSDATTEKEPLTPDLSDVPQDIVDFYSGLLINLRDEYLQPQDDWYGEVQQKRSTRKALMGGEEEDLYVEDKDLAPNSPSLAEIVTEDISSYYKTGDHYRAEICFIDAQTIKGKMEEVARQKNLTPPDLRGGRYSGLIGSPHRVAMMYCAYELLPIKWRKKFKKRELVAYSGGRQLFFPGFVKDNDPNAVLLVSSVKAFAASYEAVMPSSQSTGRWSRGTDAIKYGDGFSKFWVVPISFSGAQELRAILTSQCEASSPEIVAKLTGQPEYRRNDGPLAGTFPLVDKTCEAMVAVITHIDIIWLEHINATMKRFPKNRYSLFCYDWQIPYVKVVVTEHCIIKSIGTGSCNVSTEDYNLMLAVEKEAEFAKSCGQ